MSVEIIPTEIEGVQRICPKCFHDERGFFMESFSQKSFPQIFHQDNISCSKKAGTIRGLHFQVPPYSQAKLVSVIKGAVLDVAVDLRLGSKTFGKHVAYVLSEANKEQLFVPEGFAHGFMTLEPDTIVSYKVTNFYSKEHDRGLLWNDPDLKIAWPSQLLPPLLSEKDAIQPLFSQIEKVFA